MPPQRAAQLKFRLFYGRGEFGIKAKPSRWNGYIVETTDDRVLFRAHHGKTIWGHAFYSLPRSAVVDGL